MADIQLPDGNFVRIPDFALESTSREMLKIMEAQLGSNKEALKIYEKILEEAEEEAKRDEKSEKKTEEFRREQIKNFKDLAKSIGQRSAGGRAVMSLADSAMMAGKAMLYVGKTAAPAIITAFGTLTKSVYNVGSTLGELAQVGVGFTDAGGTAIEALSGIQALGFSAKDASNLLAGYSNVVQTVGKRSFVDLQNAFASATGFGTEFGMTMSESSAILAEDLDRRQQLGILGELDAGRAAKRSADLYKQQLEATTILGKSIDDIRKASEQTLTDNAQAALRIQSIAAGLNPEAAREFVRGMERALGDLAAVGLDQSLVNTIGAAATELVAFGSDATSELFSAVAVLDSKAGTAINETIRAANELSKTDPQAAQRMLNNLDEQFRDAAMSLNAADFQELQGTLAMQGAQGEALALSLAQLRTAAQNLQQPLDVAGKQFPGLAKGAAAFDQAVAQIQGSIGSLLTGIAGTFSGPMETLAEAFTQTGTEGDKLPSVLSSLMTSVQAVGQALNNLFTRLFSTSSATGTLADRIRSFADTQLKSLTDKVVSFIEKFDVDAFKEKLGNFIDGLQTVYGVLSSIASGLLRVFSIFVDTEEITDPETGETRTKITGIDWSTIVLSVLGVVTVKALMAAAAPLVLSYMATKAGVGTVASTVATAGGGGAGGAMGGMLSGLATGLTALSNVPMAGIGKAALILGGLTLAVIGLGYALKVAAPGIEAFGKMVKSILEGLAPIIEAFGKAIKSVFEGIGSYVESFGKAMQSVFEGFGSIIESYGEMIKSVLEGIGAYVESVGTSIRTVFEGVGSFVESIGNSIATVANGIADAVTKLKTAGAEAESIKLTAQANVVERLSNIPTENIVNIAQAIDQITGSLGNFSNVVGKDGRFLNTGADLEKQGQQLDLFDRIGAMNAEAISATALSMDKVAEVYKKFAELDSSALFESARAIEAVNRSVEPDEEAVAERIGRGLMRAGQSIVEYGVNLVGGGANAPTPQLEPTETAQTATVTAAEGIATADKTQHELLAMIANHTDRTNKMLRDLTDTVRDS